MLNYFLLASEAAIAVSGVASALELPRRKTSSAASPPAPIFTWTGFYVGVNAGGAFSKHNNRTAAIAPFGPAGTCAAAPMLVH